MVTIPTRTIKRTVRSTSRNPAAVLLQALQAVLLSCLLLVEAAGLLLQVLET